MDKKDYKYKTLNKEESKLSGIEARRLLVAALLLATLSTPSFANDTGQPVTGTVTIPDGTTIENQSATQKGGAYYVSGADGKLIINGINGIVFKNNSTTASGGSNYGGGAIYYDEGTTNTIQGNVTFDGNSSASLGGAIFLKSGTLNIDATNGDIIFKNNKANGVSNAIYITGTPETPETPEVFGKLNISASEGHSVIFNDAIAGEGIIRINPNGQKGTVEINSNLNGFGDIHRDTNIFLDGGTLKLGKNVNLPPSGYAFFKVNGGTLDIQNNTVQATDLGYLILYSNMDVKIDLNLAGSQADCLTAGYYDEFSGHGNIVLKSINMAVLEGKDSSSDSVSVHIADDKIKSHIVVDESIRYIPQEIAGSSKLWVIAYNQSTGNLSFSKESLIDAVRAVTSEKSYTLTGTETLNEELGLLGGNKLTINANGNTINGNGHQGIVTQNSGQTLTINDAVIKNFTSNNRGSIIHNDGGATININNSTFMENSVSETIDGFIYNGSSQGNLIISKSLFNNNSGSSSIISNYGYVTLNDTNFTNYTSVNFPAIYNGYNTTEINAITENVTFSNIKAPFSDSGVIKNNYHLNITTKNGKSITFSNNSANDSGVIYNGDKGTTNINATNGNIYFENNIATNQDDSAGAIYNRGGVININATGGDVIFTGNKVSKGYDISSSISNKKSQDERSCGVVTFNAGNGHSITLYDSMVGDWDTTVVKTGEGTLNLNASMHNYAPILDIRQGTIKLSSANNFFSPISEVRVTGESTIDTRNNVTETLNLGHLKLNNTLNTKIDVDLLNKTIDNFVAENVEGSGKILIQEISLNLLKDNTSDLSIEKQLADEDLKGYIDFDIPNIKTNIGGQSSKYWMISYDSSTGNIKFDANYMTLKEAVNTSDPASRIYNINLDETVTEDIGTLGGTGLAIDTNNKTIYGNSKKGIIVGETGQLSIQNSTLQDFVSDNGGSIYNKGSATFNDVEFKNNTATTSGGAIYNAGNLTINAINEDIVFTGNKANAISNAIYNASDTSTINLNANEDCSITFNDSITGSGTLNINKETSSTGMLVLNADMSGYTGNVAIDKGTIKLEKSGSLFTNASNVDVKEITLDSQNEQIDDISFGNLAALTLNNDIEAKVDVNLNDVEYNATLNENVGKMDNYSVNTGTLTTEEIANRINNNIQGKINLSQINMYIMDESSQYLNIIAKVADNTLKNSVKLLDNANIIDMNTHLTANHSWILSYGTDYDDGGYLRFIRSDLTLKDIVNLSDKDKIYTRTTDESITENIGNLNGETLTVHGDGHTFNGQGYSGIITQNSNQILTFENTEGTDNKTIIEGFTSSGVGGFIDNTSGATVNLSKVILQNNTAADGGFIYNTGKLNISDAEFTENKATNGKGGAIYNAGGDVTLTNVIINKAVGAALNDIYNDSGKIIAQGTNQFDSDITNNDKLEFAGTNTVNGKITGSGTVTNSNILNLNSDMTGLTGTYTQTAGETNVLANSSLFGGTNVINGGTLNQFGKDLVTGQALQMNGGTLNFGNKLTITGNSYIKEAAEVNISSNNTLDIKELNSGNQVYLDNVTDKWNGTINVQDGGNLVMDKFNQGNGVYNQTGGMTTLVGSNFYNANVSGGLFALNNSSVLSLLPNATTFNPDTLIMNDNSTINMLNGTIDSISVNDMNVIGTNNLTIDINSRESLSDKIVVNNDMSGVGTLHIGDFNFVGKAPIDRELNLQIFDVNGNVSDVSFTSTDKYISTPIGKYKLVSNGGGSFTAQMFEYNPQVFRGQVATLAMYNNQLNVDNILMDHIMLQNRGGLTNPNQYASAQQMFAPYQYSKEDGGLWFKPYVDFEKLSLTHGLNVNNMAYGSLIGADFPIMSLNKGWKFIPTAYIAYNGSNQNFENVSMYQNGGQGGFMGTFVKDDFIASILAYSGGYQNEMQVNGNTDKAGNWFAGTAAKLAYNFHPAKHFIIQPTTFISYNIFGKQRWGTDFGSMSMNSGLLNGINVAPGFNLIYSRDTWSVYGTIQYMFNINEQVGGYAGNVSLESIKMRHGYIQYGIGATKTWKDRLNSYFQVVLRNGGRTGIGFQLGLNYSFNLNDFKRKLKSN